MSHDDRPTLVDLAANPALAAEVDLDHIPDSWARSRLALEAS